MSDSTQVNANRAITVPFHGAELYVVEHNGQPYTPMKQIVEGIGLDWGGQHKKVAANESRWGISVVEIPSSGGSQLATCILLRKLPGWLSTIDAGRVKNPEARAKVIQYQNECDDVLWKYWSEGIAVKERTAQSAQSTLDYDRISPAQAQDLKEIVEAIVKAGVQGFGETWARLHRKFKVNSYLELPATQHLEAREYLIAKLPKGTTENVVDDEPKARTSLDDAVRLDHAFHMAAQTAAKVQRVVFKGIMSSNADWRNSRYLLGMSPGGPDEDVVVQLQPIAYDACIVSIDRFHTVIEDTVVVEAETLTRLASTCMTRLSRMAQRGTQALAL